MSTPPPTPTRPATIHDVARQARVSPATVSRVVNSSRTVSPALVERVEAVITALDYRPSGAARGLRTRRVPVWGLVISDIRNPFFTDMVRGVEDVATVSGYSVVLCNSDENIDKERGYLDLIRREHMAGAILAAADAQHSNPGPLLDQGIPVVAVDRRIDHPRVDQVTVDNFGGAAAAVGHLIDQGYQRIACVSGPESAPTGADRLAGYMATLRAAGLAPTEELIRRADFRIEGGRIATASLLDLPSPPEAIFCANNLMTLGALAALSERGVRVPDGMAVVGFDDPEWAPLVSPQLSGVAQPTYEMGAQAARYLLSRIDGDDQPRRSITLAATLRVRHSSIRPP